MQSLSKEKYMVDSELSVLFSCLEKKKSEELAELRSPRWSICLTALQLCYHLGLRVSELRFQHKALDLQSDYPSLHVRESKFKKSRYVPIPLNLKEHIERFIVLKESWGQSTEPESYFLQSPKRINQPYSISGLESMFLSAMKEAKLPRKTIHSLRHSYGFAVYNKTKDLRATQMLLGHSSISTTQIYTYCTFDKLSQYANQI